MSLLNKKVTLNNGVEMPVLGFGTWKLEEDAVCYDMVTFALDHGYRHIDTAQAYHNEASVGRAIRESSVVREEIFVTSKLSANTKDYEGSLERFETTMKEIGLDYLDLYIIHAPWKWSDRGGDYSKENIDVWKAMEEIYQSGRVKAIGVSNFNVEELQNILDHCTIKPAVNQIYYYAGGTQDEVVEFCKKHDIAVVGHSPFGHGKILEHTVLKEMAAKYHRSVPQICIRYCLQKDVYPLPKTSHKEYAVMNADVDFEISKEDMILLDQIKHD